jgi:hypothetical protein
MLTKTHKNQKFNPVRDQFINITHWEPCDQQFHSQFGLVSYLDWCEKEAARLNRSTGALAEVTPAKDLNGNCCIAKRKY